MWNERFANAAGATPSVCWWPTGHAPTFNIYCRWPTGHAPTFNIVGGPPGTPLPSPYTAGGPPGTPLLIYSSGSQQGFPTHIPPLTIASLPTRGVLCQRHSPECNYTLPQTILLISHMHVLNFLTFSYNYLLGIIIMLWQRGKFGRSQTKPKEK